GEVALRIGIEARDTDARRLCKAQLPRRVEAPGIRQPTLGDAKCGAEGVQLDGGRARRRRQVPRLPLLRDVRGARAVPSTRGRVLEREAAIRPGLALAPRAPAGVVLVPVEGRTPRRSVRGRRRGQPGAIVREGRDKRVGGGKALARLGLHLSTGVELAERLEA